MTLPTGAISLADVLAELRTVDAGRASTISLQDSDVRALAGVSGAACSLDDLRGKTAYVAMSGNVPDVPDAEAPSNPASSTTASIPVAVSYAGGRAPFSFAWSKISGSGSVTAANSADTVAVMPVARFSEPGEVSSIVLQCVITDATGATLTRQGTVTLTLT